jgi:hypothetical protein
MARQQGCEPANHRWFERLAVVWNSLAPRGLGDVTLRVTYATRWPLLPEDRPNRILPHGKGLLLWLVLVLVLVLDLVLND